MRFRAIKADALYALRAWMRSRSSLVVSLAFPVLLLVVLGVVFGGASRAVLHVQDLDGSNATVGMLKEIEAKGVKIEPAAWPEGTNLTRWMRESEIKAYLRVPEGAWTGRALPTLALSASDPNAAAWMRDVVEAAAPGAVAAPPKGLLVRTVPLERNVPYTSYLLPGVIGLNVLSVGLFTSFGYVAQLRLQGLLGRLAVSPMTKSEWLAARMIGQSAAALLITVFLILVAALIFRTAIVPSPWVLVLVVVGTLVFSGLGTVVGGLIKNPAAASTAITLIYFPMLFLSGAFFDRALLPSFLRWIPDVIPLTYLNDGLRQAMILGDGRAAAIDAGALAVFSLVLIAFGGRLIDWTERD